MALGSKVTLSLIVKLQGMWCLMRKASFSMGRWEMKCCQETEDVRHSVYDSMDVPENTEGRSEGKNLWVWDPRARWGLMRERCET